MVEHDAKLCVKLLELMQKTGYNIVQHNGQRRFGPPSEWTGPPPPKGCEIFIGKLPRDVFEDELVPLCWSMGKIYEMRLMMDFSGSNRGYAFVTYATRSEAAAAVKKLNDYEIRPGRHIGVAKSVDNCKLYIGNIPKDKTKSELLEELSKHVTDIVDVIVYKNSFDRNFNRGFAFVEFTSHKAAAMARRALVPGCVKLWSREVNVDWAEPEPVVDDEHMMKVKVLYVRNFEIWTTPETIQKIFEENICNKIERIKKIYDYAFIHFYEREHAELAMAKLQNAGIDGCNIEIRWAKPVDRDLYRIQKLNKGNAKFNNRYDLAHTLMLYKQHVEKKEYANSSPKDEGIGSSACAGDSTRDSPMDLKTSCSYLMLPPIPSMAPAKLDSMCKGYYWTQPVYTYQNYKDLNGIDLWVCTVDLPHIGPPLVPVPRRIGPLMGRPCYSMQQANVEAAEVALESLKMLQADLIQQSVPAQPVYLPMAPVQNCANLPYEYPSMFPPTRPVIPLPISAVWRTV